jgi:hypothetical protein
MATRSAAPRGGLAGPRITCKIYFDDTGQPCHGQRTTTVDASALVGPGVSCQAVRVFAAIFQSPRFLTGLPVGSSAQLIPSNAQPSCLFDLSFMGTTMAAHTRIGDYYDLELSNGRHLVALAGVDLISGCASAAAMTCSVSLGEDLALVRCAE